MKYNAPRWHDSLVLSQVLGILLLALSYLRLLGDSQSMAFRDHVLDSLYTGPIWGTTLSHNLIKFALAMVLLHLLFGVACWVLGHLSLRAWPSEKTTVRQHLLIWFILVTAGVLANNAAMFTTSSLGQPYAELMTSLVLGVPLGRLILGAVLFAVAITTLVAAIRWWRAGGRLSRLSYIAAGVVGIAYLAPSAQGMWRHQAPSSANQPNVILIGLDSLRQDLLDEQHSPNVTPHLAAFMRDGVQFTNAITPLARTFPSMCSMLTGRHPHSSGAVMNLLPRNLIDDSDSLPRLLSRAGYQTVYATDETRFANIDSSYGFAQTITPPIGASEFLIEKLADAPLFNLLVNTRAVGSLFPHVYANRGASRTYDPDVFVKRLDGELAVDKPLFLVTHLTLSHWPYIWAGAPIKRADDQARWPPYYLHAAERVDQQFADIMGKLEKKGLLRNAIVIVYSDHGESFGVHNEALVPDEDPLIHALGAEPIWGHGSTVLTAHQFRIVLGARRFGATWQAQGKNSAPISFEDIAPTIVDLLGIRAAAPFDGRSMTGLLRGEESQEAFQGRIRFTETEYLLPADFATPDGDVSPSKVEEALAVYRIDRVTDRITVKQSHLGQLLQHRQYAAVGDRHLVAAIPRKDKPGFSYIAVDLNGGAPRQLLKAPDADEVELSSLWTELHRRYLVLGEHAEAVGAPTVASSGQTLPANVTK